MLTDEIKKYLAKNLAMIPAEDKPRIPPLSEDEKRMVLLACFEREEEIENRIGLPEEIMTSGFEFRPLHHFKYKNIGGTMGADEFDWDGVHLFEVSVKGSHETAYAMFSDRPRKFMRDGEIENKFYDALREGYVSNLLPFQNPIHVRMGLVKPYHANLKSFEHDLKYFIEQSLQSRKDPKAPFGIRPRGLEIVLTMKPKDKSLDKRAFLVRDEENNFYMADKGGSRYSDYEAQQMVMDYISQSRKEGNIPPKALSYLVDYYKDMEKDFGDIKVMVADGWKERIKFEIREEVEMREVRTTRVGFKA